MADTPSTIQSIFAQVKARGWPTYAEDKDLCMERAYEFLTLLEEAGLRPSRGDI